MDFSQFGDEHFNVKRWINNSINLSSQSSPPVSVDSHITTMILKLQVLSSEINNSIEDYSQQVISAMPKSLRDIDRLNYEVNRLSNQISTFYETLSTIEGKSSISIRFLSEIDDIKIRMENCALTLQKSQYLFSLISDADSLFVSKDIFNIAPKIKEMKESYDLVKSLPQFKDSYQQISAIQNRLESTAKQSLIESLSSHNSEKTKKFIELFAQIDKQSELSQYYFQMLIKSLENLWTSFAPQPFSSFLPTFFNQIIDLLNSEFGWSCKIFPDEFEILPNFISYLMKRFHPDFQAQLQSSFLEKREGKEVVPSIEKIDELILTYNIAKNFGRNIRGLILNFLPSFIEEKEKLYRLFSQIYLPYAPFQENYSNYEKFLLRSLLLKLKGKGNDDDDEGFLSTIGKMRENGLKLFRSCEGAVDRCISFTGGAESQSLLVILNEIISEFIQQHFELLKTLRVKSRVDLAIDDLKQKDEKTSQSSSTSTFEVFSHDWTYVQGSLQSLQLANEFSSKLNNFDRILRSKFASHLSTYFTSYSFDQFSMYNEEIEIYHFDSRAKFESLFHFYRHLTDVSFKLLSGAQQSYISYSSSVQSFVFDTMFHFIREKLADLPSFPNWEKSANISSTGVEMPTFSLPPLNYITQIGQHLFTLPQQLEPYAVNQSSSSPHSSNSNIEIKENYDDNEDEANFEINDGENNSNNNTSTASSNENVEDEGFVYQWISAISRSTMSLYLQKITQIKKLSPLGTKQLVSDIEYLSEVLCALGVPLEDVFASLLQFLKTPENEYASALSSITDTNTHKLAKTVSEMRNIKI